MNDTTTAFEARNKVAAKNAHFYLRQGGNVFARVCLFVCLSVSKITQKVMEGAF